MVAGSTSETDTCLVRLRQLVLTGALMPGEKLNQADLAERLGVSRVPVREALASLRSEGLVEARPNSGFTVVRPTIEGLAEIYLMRGLLEDALLATVDTDALDVVDLRQLNARLSQLDPIAEFADFREVNEQFHFVIFEGSPHRMIRSEVIRLWSLSDFYRAIYIRADTAHRRVIDDHDRIVDAIELGDRDALVALSREHRGETQEWMTRVLSRRSS